MRPFLLTFAVPFLLSTTAVVAAGPQAQQSAQDLECKYSGDCGAADADQPTQPKGPTKGFSLSRPSAMAATPAAQAAPARSTAQSVRSRPAATRVAMNAPVRSSVGVSHGDLLITFASGSTDITPQGLANARAFAEALQRPKLAGMRFLITGHTDAIGTREANIDLSQRRAQAVADYLAAQGVSRDRLQVQGHGFDDPLPGKPATSALNRRVEAEKLSNG